MSCCQNQNNRCNLTMPYSDEANRALFPYQDHGPDVPREELVPEKGDIIDPVERPAVKRPARKKP